MGHQTRRLFLTSAGAAAGLYLRPAWLRAASQTSRLTAVLAQTIGIDMHNHVYPAGTEPHPHQTPDKGAAHSLDGSPPPAELDLAHEIESSGFSAVCASFVLDTAPVDKDGEERSIYLAWLTAIDASLKKDNIRRALTLSDLQHAHSSGQPTIVQSVEGAQFIEGDLARLQEVYRRGLRHLQLLHMRDDRVAPLGDVATSPAHLGGLTDFGAEVIKECGKLGILVDLAHGTPETIQGALRVAKTPVLVSHTALDSQWFSDPRLGQAMKPHLISKETAKLVADAGGVIGVWPKFAASPADYVRNLRAMVDAIGVDHVGIGSDTDLLSTRLGQGTNADWAGLKEGFFYTVVEEMLGQGFLDDEIRKVCGGNFCRIFHAATRR